MHRESETGLGLDGFAMDLSANSNGTTAANGAAEGEAKAGDMDVSCSTVAGAAPMEMEPPSSRADGTSSTSVPAPAAQPPDQPPASSGSILQPHGSSQAAPTGVPVSSGAVGQPVDTLMVQLRQIIGSSGGVTDARFTPQLAGLIDSEQRLGARLALLAVLPRCSPDVLRAFVQEVRSAYLARSLRGDSCCRASPACRARLCERTLPHTTTFSFDLPLSVPLAPARLAPAVQRPGGAGAVAGGLQGGQPDQAARGGAGLPAGHARGPLLAQGLQYRPGAARRHEEAHGPRPSKPCRPRRGAALCCAAGGSRPELLCVCVCVCVCVSV
jgi:hypothetical protein